jgi:hypothetical protein
MKGAENIISLDGEEPHARRADAEADECPSDFVSGPEAMRMAFSRHSNLSPSLRRKAIAYLAF